MIYSLELKEKCFVIVGAGSLASGDLLFEKRKSDLIAAADAGYLYLQEKGMIPDIIIGDFDSSDEPASEAEIIELPVEKDDTDIVYCVREGFRRGFKNFLIYGGLGGDRLSHTIANLQLLSMVKTMGGKAEIKYGNISVFIIGEGDSLTFSPSVKGHFSVFSLTEQALVSLKNFYYPLEKGILQRDYPLGVSNHFTGKTAEITVHEGEVLTVIEETG